GLTGGGDLTDNRTIDLTNTAKPDIAKGVTAHGWGNHAGRYFGAIGGNVNDLDAVPLGTAMKAAKAASLDAGFKEYGSGFSMGYSDDRRTQIWYDISGDMQIRYTNSSGIWQPARTFWHDDNLPQSSIDS